MVAVQAWERIDGMNHPQRSGDIVLIMKNKTSDTVNQRYTSGVSCKSWHGSLNPSDSYVPFILAYPGGNKYEIENIFKTENTFTAIPGCSKEGEVFKCDFNYRLTDIAKEIIKEQYGTQ